MFLYCLSLLSHIVKKRHNVAKSIYMNMVITHSCFSSLLQGDYINGLILSKYENTLVSSFCSCYFGPLQ